jgi:hypothetical protein
MSRSNQHPTGFAYHAQAIGFSASLHKPCCENIPGQAAVSLSQTGGESYSVVRNFDWKGIFRFDEASAYVTGSSDHGSHNTLATVTVRGLNIANMITADQIIARVSSRHERASDGTIGEGEITLSGSSFHGLRIAGHPVDVPLELDSCVPTASFADMSKVASERGFVNQKMQSASYSVATPRCEARDLTFDKGKIHIPEFGTIYLATVIFKPGYRRISMLRADLGCPIGGGVEVSGGEGNGTEIWG